MSHIEISPITTKDADWVNTVLVEHWTSHLIASRGKLIDASKLPGFIAWLSGEKVGLVTCRIEGQECEIVSLNSFREKTGAGAALLEAARKAAKASGCQRAWLTTTNDNVDAIRFYLKRGLRLVAVHLNALDVSRQIKPSIPNTGCYDLPLLDEWEFELPMN